MRNNKFIIQHNPNYNPKFLNRLIARAKRNKNRNNILNASNMEFSPKNNYVLLTGLFSFKSQYFFVPNPTTSKDSVKISHKSDLHIYNTCIVRYQSQSTSSSVNHVLGFVLHTLGCKGGESELLLNPSQPTQYI